MPLDHRAREFLKFARPDVEVARDAPSQHPGGLPEAPDAMAEGPVATTQ